MEIQNGGMVIIKGDNIENGGLKIVKNYGGADKTKKQEEPLTDVMLMEKIDRVRKHISAKRHWFPVCKYMMWRHVVAEGDFVMAAAKIETLYPDVKLDASDLSRLNVLTFRKSLDKWDANDAPVGNGAFNKYMMIAELMDV